MDREDRSTLKPGEPDAVLSSQVVASRRGFIKAGLAAGPIVLSVVNRPAWANNDKDKDKDKDDKNRGKDGLTESAAASSTHLSHHPRRA
jgi:hypothetical protein